MNTVYFLSTCSTCQRILKELNLGGNFKLQDIKTNKISEQQIDELAQMAGSYEALFSRRALKYKSLGLAQKQLTENDYRTYMLDEYTFLKRPLIIYNGHLFIASSKKGMDDLKKQLY